MARFATKGIPIALVTRFHRIRMPSSVRGANDGELHRRVLLGLDEGPQPRLVGGEGRAMKSRRPAGARPRARTPESWRARRPGRRGATGPAAASPRSAMRPPLQSIDADLAHAIDVEAVALVHGPHNLRALHPRSSNLAWSPRRCAATSSLLRAAASRALIASSSANTSRMDSDLRARRSARPACLDARGIVTPLCK